MTHKNLKMKKDVNFSHIKQCDQIWENMNPCRNGRECSKCSHIITDFRGMTNWEIAVIHANSEQKVCGLYDRNFFTPIKSTNHLTHSRKLTISALFSLLSFTINSDIEAQTNEPQELTEVEQRINNEKTNTRTNTNTTVDSTKIIRGYLYDENNDPLFGGTIIIKGTNYGTVTDYDGSFSLDVTNTINKKGTVTLLITYTGFGKQELHVSKEDFIKEMEFEMLPIVIAQEEIITSFGIRRESFPKRAWRGLTNIFRKKK